MRDELDLLAQSMNEVPPLHSAARARLSHKLSVLLLDEARPRNHMSGGNRRGRVGVLAAVAAVAALTLVATTVLVGRGSDSSTKETATGGPEQPDLSLISFNEEDDVVIAEITDPEAAKSQLDAAFRDHGFDIAVNVIPVSPSLVGSIVQSSTEDTTSGLIQPIQAGPCVTGGGGGCTIGLKIPVGYKGHANVTVGRAAGSGEEYLSAAPSIGPGEALHCSGIIGQSVASALPILQARNITAEWREITTPLPKSGDEPVQVEETTHDVPPPDYYLTDVTSVSRSAVMAHISPEPPTGSPMIEGATEGC